MAQSDKFILILDKLSDIGERTARMEAKQENIIEDLREVKRQDNIQNNLLAIHIKGVETAHARLENEIIIRKSVELAQLEIKNRVDRLEEPNKFFETLKKYAMYIIAVGGAAVMIRNWFNK